MSLRVTTKVAVKLSPTGDCSHSVTLELWAGDGQQRTSQPLLDSPMALTWCE